MTSEFALIERYFRRAPRDPVHTVLGVGDDAALVRPSPGCELVISTDMLVAGTHFLPDTEAADLGWKTLAVNVSDLAAMGATPRWALLAAALPGVDNAATEAWIESFAGGFFACADAYGIDVIGGDTTRGPLNFCVTIFGETPARQALLRSGAQPGDEVWVSGTPGRAALGLAHLQGRITLAEPVRSDCLAALHRPQPRIALGLALRGLATAAIDVSDGLLADLGHILKASGVSATLSINASDSADAVPINAAGPADAVPPAPTFARNCYLSGGDDYELVFTAAAARHAEIDKLAASLALPLTCLGRIEAGAPDQLRVLDADGAPVQITRRGYDHFS